MLNKDSDDDAKRAVQKYQETGVEERKKVGEG